MPSFGERLRRRLGRVNPTTIAGIGLLAAGLGMTIIRLVPSDSADASASLSRALASVIQLTQRAILWGDDTVGDPQFAFNSVVVAVFVEGLSPKQQQALGVVANLAASLLGDLFSLPGMITLALLVAAHFGVARAFDLRYPEARRPDEKSPRDPASL